LQKGINHTETRSETVTLNYKAIHQVSILYTPAKMAKIRSGKLKKSQILLSSRGITLAKMN
jgi:hypothetical protein